MHTTKEYLLEKGFKEKEPFVFFGNGADNRLTPEQGGSKTIQNDFVLDIEKSRYDFVVRFEEFIYKGKEKIESDGISITFHYCEWRPKIYDTIPCFDTSKVEYLEMAFKMITGKELKSK